VQLRRLSWLSRDHELVGDDGRSLAQLRLRAFREAGEVLLPDGRRWSVHRDPNFGPWRLEDGDGATLVTATKEGLGERFTVAWPAGTLRLERRAALGRRHLEVLDGVSGAGIGEVRPLGLAGHRYDLDLPAVPQEVVGTIAWLVAMLAQRDAAVAAQH
jgi:hypothetical protein